MAIILKTWDWKKTLDSAKNADLIFLDPPFNLKKKYDEGISDSLSAVDYLAFVENLATQCFAAAAKNAFCVINIPPRLISIFLPAFSKDFSLVDIVSRGSPVPFHPQKKLVNGWYALLIFSKGEPKISFGFRKVKTCGKCGDAVGRYKPGLTPSKVSINNLWIDLPPQVTGAKLRRENELPLELMCRIISLFTPAGGLVCDPFLGVGTTAVAARFLNRSLAGGDLSPESLAIAKKRVAKFRSVDIARFLRWRDLR